jgi:hypothetical protein
VPVAAGDVVDVHRARLIVDSRGATATVVAPTAHARIAIGSRDLPQSRRGRTTLRIEVAHAVGAAGCFEGRWQCPFHPTQRTPVNAMEEDARASTHAASPRSAQISPGRAAINKKKSRKCPSDTANAVCLLKQRLAALPALLGFG